MSGRCLCILFLLSYSCSNANQPVIVDVEAEDRTEMVSRNDSSSDSKVGDSHGDGPLAQDLVGDSALSDATVDDSDASQDQANTDVDDSTTDPGKTCVADNSPEALVERDGFIHVCADATSHPEAVCGDGSPYRFSYRPAQGQSKGLLLYFRGGGACSDYVTCWGLDGLGGDGRRVATMSNNEYTGPGVHPLLGRTLGIFYLDEPANPLLQYDQVHIAYCTGDAGLKNEEAVLNKPDEALASAPASIKTYFHGQANISFALDSMHDLFPAPDRLVIVGSSAGSWASMASVEGILQRWNSPAIPVAYYGEGGIGVGSDDWNQAVLELLGDFDGTGGKRLVRFAQFSFISDAVQRSFAPAEYQDPNLFQAEMRNLMETRAAEHPTNYRYFAMPGACHTLAQNPGLFQQFTEASGSWKPVQPPVKPNPDLTLDEVNLLTWVTALVENDMFPEVMNNMAGDWETVSTTCLMPGG